MLEQARKRSDIEWVLGDLCSVDWDQEFELVVMTGHAFQVFVSDDELRAGLAAIRRTLVDGGRFAFETRNPMMREWERWTPENVEEATDASGTAVRMKREVETPVAAGVVRFTHTFTSLRWDRPQVSHSTLRFVDAGSLSFFLAEAHMEIEQQFGDWNGEPLTEMSPEIITIARRS
jgi:hypothetical protein